MPVRVHQPPVVFDVPVTTMDGERENGPHLHEFKRYQLIAAMVSSVTMAIVPATIPTAIAAFASCRVPGNPTER